MFCILLICSIIKNIFVCYKNDMVGITLYYKNEVMEQKGSGKIVERTAIL